MMIQNELDARSWDILLLGGASGTGKTSISYRIARHFDIALTEVDDFQIVLECLTTPEQQSVLHYWRTHPAPHTLSAEQILAQTIPVGQVFVPALAAIIQNHVETRTSLVLEGDYILPELVAHPVVQPLHQAGRVRAVFLYEPDEAQLVRNLLKREPEAGA